MLDYNAVCNKNYSYFVSFCIEYFLFCLRNFRDNTEVSPVTAYLIDRSMNFKSVQGIKPSMEFFSEFAK